MLGFSKSGRALRRGFAGTGTVVALVASSFVLLQAANCPFLPVTGSDLVADAGADQTVAVGNSVSLTASATGGRGSYDFSWRQTGGPTLTIVPTSADTASISVSGTASGVATLEVTVTDSAGSTDTDTAQVTVVPALVANAGADTTVVPGGTANLTATASGGSGTITFAWAQTSAGSAGTATLSSTTTAATTVTFSADAAGSFTFTVTATDGTGNSTTDSVVVTVSQAALTFTLGLDALSGTSSDDTFTAPVDLVSGVQTSTLQSGDSANGGGGTDTLNVTFAGGAATIVPTLTAIETMNVTDVGTGAKTITGTNVTGLTTVNLVSSQQGLTINNLATAVTNIGLNASTTDLSLSFLAAATTGASDAVTLTLTNSNPGAGANGSTVTLTTGAINGFESLTINSAGAANKINQIVQTTGTTLATVAITGSQNLEVVAALPATVTTVNAGAFTGNLVGLTVGTTGVAFTGGSGNDTVIYGANYSTTSTIDGGAGTNTLGLTSAVAAPAATQSNVSNIQALVISDLLTTSSTVTRFGTGVNAVTLDVGFNGGTLTYAAGTNSLAIGKASTNANSTGAAAVTVSGSATTDVLNMTLNDADFAGALVLTGVETLNLVSNIDLDGTDASGSANVVTGVTTMTNTAANETLNVSGNAALTLTGVVTADTINASTFTKALTMGAVTANAVTITGGSGADQLRGSASADIISAGAGNDTVSGEAGADILTLGAGVDTVQIRAAAADGADRKTVTDFDDTPSTGDIINIDSDDLATLDGTDNFASASSLQTHSTAGNLTIAAATEVVIVTSATVTNFTDANSLNGTNLLTAIGGTITAQAIGNEHLFAVADASGNVGIYYGDAGANTDIAAAELTLVAVLSGSNVQLSGLVYQNFTNAAGL